MGHVSDSFNWTTMRIRISTWNSIIFITIEIVQSKEDQRIRTNSIQTTHEYTTEILRIHERDTMIKYIHTRHTINHYFDFESDFDYQ
jgi:hypothetical protein